MKPKKNTGLVTVLTVLIIALLIANAAVLYLQFQISKGSSAPAQDATEAPTTEATVPTTEETEPPTTTMPDPEHVVSTATILSTGDLVMHIPVINTGLQNDGSYNFDSIF